MPFSDHGGMDEGNAASVHRRAEPGSPDRAGPMGILGSSERVRPEERLLSLAQEAGRSMSLAVAVATQIGPEWENVVDDIRGPLQDQLRDLSQRLTDRIRDGSSPVSQSDRVTMSSLPFGSLRGRSLISSWDLSAEETEEVIRAAIAVKRSGFQQEPGLAGKCLALIFEKPSLRTRVSFEVGMAQLGGHPIHLSQADIGLGTRESIEDVARGLSRWVQGIAARTFRHETVLKLAQYATIPVINALSDLEHPCQALADFMTIIERAGSAREFPLAWVGDGNNVCHSLLIVGALLGAHIRVASPVGYLPNPRVVQQAQKWADERGGSIELTQNPVEAVRGARAVYTDVWVSMGEEAERERRLQVFPPYRIDSTLMAHAHPDAFVLHCLPAHLGEEITDEIYEGPRSAIFDQAENRLHIQRALLAMMLG